MEVEINQVFSGGKKFINNGDYVQKNDMHQLLENNCIAAEHRIQ